MKRLIELIEDDGSALSESERELAELVSGVHPMRDAPGSKQMMLRRLVMITTAASGGGWFGVRGGRTLAWGAAAVFASAMAAATAGTRHKRDAVQTPATSPIAAPAASTPPAPTSSAAASSAGSIPRPGPEGPSRPSSLRQPKSGHSDSSEGEDPALVLEAIRALRTDGDAARATELLRQYIKTYPRGVLSDDAMALLVEASVARHDSRSAADAARRYLARFPNGRYAAFATNALQGEPSPR